MIDAKYQQRGFGEQDMRLLIDYESAHLVAKNMLLSFMPKENDPEGFYKRFGFVRTGEEDEGESIMKLPLDHK